MTAIAEPAVMPAASKPRQGKSKVAGDQVAAPPAVSVPLAVQLIPLALLDDNPANPRDDIGDVAELIDSIRSVGLLEPLIVAPATLFWPAAGDGEPLEAEADRFVIIAGHRRKAACERAPVDPVPCIVRGDLVGGRDEDAMLIENLHREDLTPLEEARGYQRLIDRHKLSQRDVADRVGRNQSHISKTLALLKLPAAAQTAVTAGKVTLEEARALLPLAADEARISEVIDRRPSWQTLEQAVAIHVDALDRAAKVAELIGQLKREGKTYIKTVAWNAYLNQLPDAARKGHDKQPCHAFTILHGTPRIEPVCSQPDRHKPSSNAGPAGTVVDKKAAAEKAKQDKEEAERKQQREDRLAVVQRLLGGKPSKQLEEYSIARTVALEIENAWDNDTLPALLGMTVGEDQDLGDVLTAYAAKGHTNRSRLLAAIRLDEAEREMRYATDLNREPYLQLLEQHGWTPPKVLR